MPALHEIPWPIRTERLVIRPLTDADLDAVWEFRRLPEVNAWLGRAPATRAAFHETYSERERRASTFVIELPDADGGDATIVGDLMIKVEDGWGQAEVIDEARRTQAELGWTLAPVWAGRGFATEAVRAAIDVCFGSLGLRRVHAGCFAVNEPSWRLMERLGMRREEFSRGTALHRSGEWMDGVNYALLAEEWPGRR